MARRGGGTVLDGSFYEDIDTARYRSLVNIFGMKTADYVVSRDTNAPIVGRVASEEDIQRAIDEAPYLLDDLN